MFKHNILFLLFFMLVMTGCSEFFWQSKQMPMRNPIKKQALIKPKIETKMIKGYVNSLKFTENGWQYDIIGTDTTNNKLPRVTAYAKKIYYNEKDTVYAVVIGDKISQMYLIKKADSKPSGIKKSVRPGKKIPLPLPENEKISF